MLHSIDISYFSALEGRVPYRVLRSSADRIFWKKDSPELLRLFAGSVQIFSDKTVMIFKSFVLIVILVHVVLLISDKENRI